MRQIEIFKLDLSIFSADSFLFHPYRSEQAIIYQKEIYVPMALDAEGFELTSKNLPTPSITLSNLFGLVGNAVDKYDGLRGAKLIRYKLRRKEDNPQKYTIKDWVNNPDIYIIDRPTNHNELTIKFELVSVFDFKSLKLPNRTIYQRNCPFGFKSPDCGYIGSITSCARNPADCKERFRDMTGDDNPVMNFGGFLSVDRFQS